MRNKNIFGVLSLLIIGTVFGAVLVSSFGHVRPSMAEVKVGPENPPITQISPDAQAFNDAFVNVAEKVTPSIVQILVTSSVPDNDRNNDAFKFFFPFRNDIPQERQSGGSGVIISADGYILTNNHVVENATSVDVTLHDKREFSADVVGTDPLTDLAVIKIQADDLPAAYLGNSEKLKVGQWVMAIGNPLSLASTVTAGIVSAIGRNIGIIRDSYAVENFIQTDAAINPGNSGGALVDLNGAVIGINSAIATNGFTSNYIGYGFAIPIDLAKSVSQDLIAHGKVTRGYIGVQIQAVDADLAKAVGLDKPEGVLIQSIVEDGAASVEDIKDGDIILKIDGRSISEANELQSYVASKRAGDKVELTLFRDGDMITRTVELKARDEDKTNIPIASRDRRENDSKPEIKEKEFESIGLTVQNMTGDQLKEFNLNNGILVKEVKRFSKAERQGIFRGLVIVEVDRREIDSVSGFEDAIDAKNGGAVLLKVVDKEGQSKFVGLDIPD